MITSSDDPVVVTGLGIISPAGCTIETFFDSICTGKSAISKLERFDPTPFKCQIAAQVNDYFSAFDAILTDC